MIVESFLLAAEAAECRDCFGEVPEALDAVDGHLFGYASELGQVVRPVLSPVGIQIRAHPDRGYLPLPQLRPRNSIFERHSIEILPLAMVEQRWAYPARFAAEFSGTDRTVADYLLAEVLERQPAAVRLLLRTSNLDRINGELADLLTGDQGPDRRGLPCVRRITQTW